MLGRRWAALGHTVTFGARKADDLSVARLLESLAMLWIRLVVRRKPGRKFAFALLRQDS